MQLTAMTTMDISAMASASTATIAMPDTLAKVIAFSKIRTFLAGPVRDLNPSLLFKVVTTLNNTFR